MTLDHYSLCPCGSGKKIKFCCSNDILPELEKVIRAIEGEQRTSAVDQLTHLMEYKGKRAALLALKTQVQLALGDADGATQSSTDFLQRDPTNTLALALSTMAACLREDVISAVQKVHKTLEVTLDRQMIDESLLAALHGVGSLLLSEGDVMGARAYFVMHSVLSSEGEHVVPSRELNEIDRSTAILPLMKQEFTPRDCPPAVVWKAEFDAAKSLYARGLWWKACEAFEQLSTRYPSQPSILYNLAALRSRLGNPQLAASAWRAYGLLPSVPQEEAVEMLALARALDHRNEESIDGVVIEVPLNETDRLMERLLSDKRFSQMPEMIEEWNPESGPRPKGVFRVLDRPLPAASDELTLSSLPCIQATLFVFGRQTDRAARAEISSRQTPQLPEVMASIRTVLGESAGEPGTPRVVGKVPLINTLLEPSFVVPQPADREKTMAMLSEWFRKSLTEVWPKKAWKALDGKKPADVANDPVYKTRVLAEILLIDLRTRDSIEFDFNQLRSQLGLPTLDPIDPTSLDITELPLVRLPRVIVDKLEDGKLATMLERANYHGLATVAQNAGNELLRRESLRGTPARLLALTVCAQSANTPEEVMERYREAAELAVNLQRSPAPYLFGELQFALLMGAPERVMELVQRLQTRHGNEPGVAQALAQLLGPFLSRGPDGRTVLRLPRMGNGAPGSPAKPAGGLWTPDQGAPAAAAPPPVAAAPPPAAKSKLWVPGMD